MSDFQFPEKFKVLFERPDSRYFCFYSGRGTGKSHSIARFLLIKAMQSKIRVMCARETLLSLNESVHYLLKSIIEAHDLTSFFDVQRDKIIGANGSEFLYCGLRTDPAKIRSTEALKYLWCEESDTLSQESLDLALPTIRMPGSQIIFSLNPRFVDDPVYDRFVLHPPKNCVTVRLQLSDNPFASAETRQEMEDCRIQRPHLFDWIWKGELQQSSTLALFNWADVNNNRKAEGFELPPGRTLVSLDPAVTAHKKSDETGIIVGSNTRATPRHYFILADGSGRFSPETWATRALQLYDTFQADAIVAEVNQGYDLVAQNIKSVCANLGRPCPKIIEVKATKGKILRAEPIASLYEQGLVHHVGRFSELENQMLRFDPADIKAKSPDRVDALVHMLAELSSGRAPMKIATEALARLVTGR